MLPFQSAKNLEWWTLMVEEVVACHLQCRAGSLRIHPQRSPARETPGACRSTAGAGPARAPSKKIKDKRRLQVVMERKSYNIGMLKEEVLHMDA